MCNRYILFFCAAAVLAAPVADTSPACAAYELISARGTNEMQGPSIGFTGMIKATLDTIQNGVEYDVVYPAATDLTQLTTLIGSGDIVNHITNGLKKCPQQRYGFLGYSQGSTVVLQALQQLTGKPAEASISSVILIGNPYNVANQKTTVDENGGGATRQNSGSLLFLNHSIGLSQHWVESGKVLNICYTKDLVCNGIKLNNLFSNAHSLYSTNVNVQKMGSDFMAQHLKEISI